ncbi:MAG TPA: hypothetical protein VGP99_07340, partial [Tepidisphaeraceae bacterium]|nr:hypothetical protein [Tepidisphaeraceae bacterium]
RQRALSFEQPSACAENKKKQNWLTCYVCCNAVAAVRAACHGQAVHFEDMLSSGSTCPPART